MALVVRLNGSNFVSEKTKTAFEKALQDEHQVKSTTHELAPSRINPESVSPISKAETRAMAQPALDYQRVLESLERGLAQSYDHQSVTLRVHEQYLNNQAEYAKIFHQLMQQQYELFSNGNATHQQAESALVVLESLTRSMMRFHDYQVETLGAHEQHLNNQAEYSKAFVQLLQQQYATLTNGNGSHHLVEAFPAAPAIAQDSPVTPSIASPQISSPAFTPAIPVTTPAPPPASIPDQISGSDVQALSQTLLEVVSEKTGYPAEMLELDMDMEADLGIDSIKRVEILGTVQALHPDLPQVNPEELAELRTLGQIVDRMGATLEKQDEGRDGNEAPDGVKDLLPSGLADIETLSQTLLEVVSEKTGYPAEMLELDMDMEADLGIDSIKRVEILGTVQALYPDLPQVSPEELAELRTLGQITARLGKQIPVTVKKKRPAKGAQPTLNHNIQRSLVKLKSLPLPDALEFTLPAKHICLITDDGSLVSIELAQALSRRGWKVLVLSFPASVVAGQVPSPQDINRVVLQDMDEGHLEQQLVAISQNYGPVGAFIHLNPYNGEGGFPESEKAIVKHVFFLAKHLKQSLTNASRIGRSCFLTVARLDGEFGLGQTTDFGAIGGGLFGLTKTLNLEWEAVFCRAIDLHPDLDAELSVQHIVAEICDPNRLIVEVGYSLQGRSTLVSE